jgi:hypothetical protein
MRAGTDRAGVNGGGAPIVGGGRMAPTQTRSEG